MTDPQYYENEYDYFAGNDNRLNDVRSALEGAECFDPEEDDKRSFSDLPITPLGYSNGTYYFISVDGEKRDFKARDLVRLNISSLFGGNTAWLCRQFPCYNKKGDVIDGAFSANEAAEWLMRSCSQKGQYNTETPLRGLGVWRAGSDVVAHLGSRIWHRGEKKRAGVVVAGAIYAARPKLEEPDFDNPISAYDAQLLRKYLNAWAFTQSMDADLLFGFLGAGLLGGFPSWRVHALVMGERGSGKSTLGEFLMNAIGAQGTSLNDYTEAGLRQTLTNEGRTLHLDEGESSGEEKAHRMAKVIGLLRLMSGGVGAKIARGSSGGTAMNSTVTGCVLLTAINPPPLQPQDKSRIFVVSIDKPKLDRPASDIKLFLDEARRLSPALRARAIMNAARFEKTSVLYRESLVQKGCDARQADLYATLCAGRSLLVHDEMPSKADVDSYVALLQDRLHLIMIEDSEASDAQSCLNRLLDAQCEAIRDGLKRSVGMIVQEAFRAGTMPENEKLIPMGIKIVDVERLRDGAVEKVKCLFVANDHNGLKRVFYNTPWADGNWRASLLRLKGVKPSPKPISVNRKTRGLLLPPELLPLPDGESVWDFENDPVPL